jgi:quercetin dioxygenase-like cupin family protein
MFKRMMFCVGAAILSIALGYGPAAAQQASQPQAIKRTILQTHDVPGTPYESVLGIAEIAPNAEVARHTHPGIENGYVLEGSLTLYAEEHPTMTLKTGDSMFMPAGIVHWGTGGPTGAKILAVWVVEKGKPLASPAPAK